MVKALRERDRFIKKSRTGTAICETGIVKNVPPIPPMTISSLMSEGRERELHIETIMIAPDRQRAAEAKREIAEDF